MGTRVWTRVPDSSSDITGTSKLLYQPFKLNEDQILIGSRQWFVFTDSVDITDIKCTLYATDSFTDLPSTAIEISQDVWTKARIVTELNDPTVTQIRNGFFEVYFRFSGIPIQGDTKYHMVYNAATYNPTATAVFGARVAYPDPVYATGLTISPANIDTFPMAVYFIAGPY
jgi:hypothetical protein